MSKAPANAKPQNLKLKVDRAVLVRELAYVNKCVPSSPTLPVLGCVLLAVDGDSLILKTTNMDLTLTATVDATVENSGEVCVSARKLAKILGEMADPTVAIEVDDKNAVTIKGASAAFKLLGMPGDEFPVTAPTKGDPITLKGSVLLDAVAPTLHAVSTDETRFVLNSVYLQMDKAGEVHAVATDGRRLASSGGVVAPDGAVAIVPTDAARLMVALAEAEDVVVLVGDKNITVRAGEREFVSKLIEGTYPNYKQVIPPKQPHQVEVDAAPLKAALHRVALVANETVALEFSKGRLTITGSMADVGSGAESLPLATCPAAPITIAFAPQFVIEALTACGDSATLGLTDAASPMVVKADRFLAVVMPKRVS
jgi:DNA polymerase-3 subunit beta